jgi:hypothetical protein
MNHGRTSGISATPPKTDDVHDRDPCGDGFEKMFCVDHILLSDFAVIVRPLLLAEPAQAQIAFRVLFNVLKAQRAADCHHLAFYPHVAKPFAV